MTWPVESLAMVLDAGMATQEQLAWLTGEMRRLVVRALEADMQRAWHEAFQASLAIVDDSM